MEMADIKIYRKKSGLGSCHYHCGGYPAHLHNGGQCPYKGNASTSSSSSTKSTNSGSARPTYETTTAKFYIDENYLAVNGIIDNGVTLVEMRPLCDALGIQIEWDSASTTVHCSKGDKTFSLTTNSKSAKLNGNPYALERAPKLIDGKTLLPARFVAEAIGRVVSYDASTGIITIE